MRGNAHDAILTQMSRNALGMVDVRGALWLFGDLPGADRRAWVGLEF
jgi:hypothetical protein